jgi:hypothetical protein
MINILAPDVGTIVACRFPDSKSPTVIGEKFRPCLVLEVLKRIDKPEIDLLLCYGTGQTSDCNKGDIPKAAIEIEKTPNNSLPETTRFDLKNITVIPLIDGFFANYKCTNSRFTVLAKLSKEQLELVSEKIVTSNINMELIPRPKTTVIDRRIKRL